MKHLDPISHVMTTNVKTVQISQKMSEVLRILAENQIHHVPVVDGRRLSGMISTTDIIRLNITVSTADEWSIEEVMKRNLVTIDINDSVRKAAQLLSDGIFHSLPVINNERHLIGIITSTDLIRYLVKLC
ncbi:MAG: CBS domain-containing protein [Planctomycetia bacterium]|uniref:CBS domain-containing protein n=1 Tax=Candidatus Brocadia sapporoensis TaxID=392547 RepID=A0A1V6LWX7_9BACT|nr:CBS domain-containing protein [Candidatus Brocadia sapporoensis]MCC7238538.1 CBS domain-containing protein [Candidatus Brocadia sp.]QOJ07528.1 MAG: CBS domain-containing protein [Planctomycetia bacterium]TVL96620.1 MAG: CBS domain-containing protein [Candidatus Brocadia sp. BL1]MDG6004305.1 CBS domain-containing protein [Candidatus Brocadia sp.]OQD44638.1 CBS domain-containing protein [Candidatus Brocadia sapporoensis]